MKKLILLAIVLLSFSCQSNDEELRSLSTEELLTSNSWVYDQTEIVDITSHGSLTYEEAKQIVPTQLYSEQDTYIFNNGGTGTFIAHSSSGSAGVQSFDWLILPDGNLRLFNMGTFNDETTVFGLQTSSSRISLTDNKEFLYQGILITYIAKSNFNAQ